MLILHFGSEHDDSMHIPWRFNKNFEDNWIDNPLAKEIILGVDKSVVVHPHVIESPILGPITPRELSGGCKGLLLMAFDEDLHEQWFYGGQFGDNTTPYMLKVAEFVKHDIHIQVHHDLMFPKGVSFKFLVDNGNTLVHNSEEYLDQYFKYS